MLSCHGVYWTEHDIVIDPIRDAKIGEQIHCISVVDKDHLLTLSEITKIKELTFSINGKTFWRSSKAKPGEPKDFSFFSAKGVKDWSLERTQDGTEFFIKNMNGIIWAVTKSKDLYKFVKGSDGTYQWQEDTSVKNVKYVFSGFDGDTWLLAEKGGDSKSELQVYHLNNGTWEAKRSDRIFYLAVGDKDHVWAIDNARKIYTWDESKSDWIYVIKAPYAKSIDAGPSGNLWKVNDITGKTYMLSDKKWIFMWGKNIQMISVGKMRVYAFDCSIELLAPQKFKFQFIPSGKRWDILVRPAQIIGKKAKTEESKINVPEPETTEPETPETEATESNESNT
jgi:hypothetical protein